MVPTNPLPLVMHWCKLQLPVSTWQRSKDRKVTSSHPLLPPRFDCDEGALENELQQLGLPKEHSSSLCRAFKDKREALKAAMEAR